MVVTLDADFHALLAFSGENQPTVIRIRIEGLKGPALAKLIQTLVVQFHQEIMDGSLITVQEHRVGIRKLPLGR